jgi:ElaB/YqjD/DUF883 family membrane-anchored ribosome-binding protein
VSTSTEHVRQQAADVADSAKQAAQEQVGQAADAGRGALRRQVDERSTQAGQQASGVADTLRHTASQLRSEGDPQKARYAQVVDQAADRLERTGRYLTEADADELLGRVEDTARRQPWMVAAAGLLAGIAAARFLKASSRDRYDQRYRTVYAAQSHRPTRELGPVEPVGGGYPAAGTRIGG